MANAPLKTVLQQLARAAAKEEPANLSDGALLGAFVAANDPRAFTVLVRRRGPMVLGVCRRVLGHEQDAEDAFQATFLLLARNAASLCRQESLAGWLHGAAWRIAKNAQRRAHRRQKHERRARAMAGVNPEWHAIWREVQAVVDGEIERLPAPYREVFILCCLENQSGPEAARQLGLKEGTVKSRLSKARALLQKALIRQGISLSAVVAASALLADRAPAAVSSGLATRTASAAAALAAGTPMTDALSANVLALLRGANMSMSATKLRVAAMTILALALAGAGTGLGLRAPVWAQLAQRQEQTGAKTAPIAGAVSSPPAGSPAKADGAVTITGCVLDPAGKPIAGAKLYLASYGPQGGRDDHRATTDSAGRFRADIARAELARSATLPPFERSRLIATRAGYGPDWINLDEAARGAGVTLRLVKDLPIKGRIRSVDGQPVAGARLRVASVTAYAPGGLDKGLEYVRQGGYSGSEGGGYAGSLGGPPPGLPKEIVTGKDGNFSLSGIGGERLVRFTLEGPSIQHWYFEVMTRNAETVRGPDLRYGAGRKVAVYGATFQYVAAESRPVGGTVRDKATGKPVAGVKVGGDVSVGGHTLSTAVTDREGRYELLGYPRSETYHLVAEPAEGQPYFGARLDRPSTPGRSFVRADIDLASGIAVKGRVRDRATKKPVAGARVEYHPLYGNPFVARITYDRFAGASWSTTREDGSYTLVALPGPGVLAVHCAGRPYMPALVTPEEIAEVLQDVKDKSLRSDSEHMITAIAPGQPGGFPQARFHALGLINPARTAASLSRDLAVDPGRTLEGSVLGPDGKPLAGATLNGAPLARASFVLEHVNPGRVQRLELHHKARQLGLYTVVPAGQQKPITVKLQPCGSATGRIVDQDGKPIANVPMRVYDTLGETDIRARTDRDGRFRVEGLIVGHTYHLLSPVGTPLLFEEKKEVSFPVFTIEPGKVKDLGEARAK